MVPSTSYLMISNVDGRRAQLTKTIFLFLTEVIYLLYNNNFTRNSHTLFNAIICFQRDLFII